MTSTRILLALSLVCLPIGAQVSPTINPLPSRQFGQSKLTFGLQTGTPNLLEGRELSGPTAIAFDTSASPPVVYIADTANNRVLVWKNPGSLTKGNPADRVIGQRDFFSAFPGGPGSTPPGLVSSGMIFPNSLAVDTNGNLFVMDAGNNRILRFPRPMEQQGELVNPDMVIGQKTPGAGNQPNQGLPKPSEKTLAISQGNSVARGVITFDSQGNLWVADTLNNRVLRYPKSRLNASEPSADLVLGQTTFDGNTPATSNQQSDLIAISRPIAVAVDDNGGVYVSDGYLRVLYYDVPSIGASAKRVLGIDLPSTQALPRPPAPNDYTLGRIGNQGGPAQCLFTLGTTVFVCDSAANRIVRYGGPETWPPLTATTLSPPIAGVYGQNTLLTGEVNRGNGLSRPGTNTLNAPTAVAFFNGEMWVADPGNNRVLAFAPAGPLNYPTATRVLGQLDFDLNAPNAADGRELFIASSGYRGSAIAVDRSSTPNRVYVADSLNNRVLGFRDVRTVGTDTRTLLTQGADIIIGQPDRYHTGINYPSYDPFIPSDQGLFTPSGVTVDTAGNLWVADTSNGRVLRFPNPFSQPAGTVHRANLVLGQSNFSIRITDATSTTMAAPVGVAVFNNGDVAASDLSLNRVLLFRKSGADFVNRQAARNVLGQQVYSTSAPSSSANGLNSPRGLAVDSSDRLYVADSQNNRVIVYASTSTTPNGATGTAIPNLNSPEGVAVSPNSGEIWVAAYGANQVFRFPDFSQLVTNPGATASLASAGPIGVALDAFDNIIAAEAANRMTFYYARAVYQHAATYASGSNLGSTLTPNMYTILYRAGKAFDFTPVNAVPPYPKTLAGLQALINGIAAPITSIQANSIYFLVPNAAPTSGDVDYIVQRPATGEILAAGNFTMGSAAPGFFTANQQGFGQVAATHAKDGSANSATNPIGQDEVLTLWLTGFGRLDNAPPDGEAPGRAISTRLSPVVTIGGTYRVPPSKLLYSGVSPEFPGLWQINIQMPKNGEAGAPLPGARVPILVQMDDQPSNIGGTNVIGQDRQLTVPNGLITTISTK